MILCLNTHNRLLRITPYSVFDFDLIGAKDLNVQSIQKSCILIHI